MGRPSDWAWRAASPVRAATDSSGRYLATIRHHGRGSGANHCKRVHAAISALRPTALLWVLAWVVASCANAPERIDQAASRFGYSRIELKGSDFDHVVYLKLSAIPDDVIHVYLEGDGTPWIGERWMADDPTPRNPLMLRLMALDPADSVYVGRPCYHGLERMPPCHPKYWTSARYSREVVASMAAVVRRILDQRRSAALRLFGHSGGGTLAMLVAEQLNSTRAVVTLAGNLDIAAWARYHRYTPLAESQNPASHRSLGSHVRQLHLVGSNDRRVPPALVQETIARWPGAQLRILEGFTHTCCWEQVWPSVLAWANGRIAAGVRGEPRAAPSGLGLKAPLPTEARHGP